MKFPQSHTITKLTLTTTKYIVMGVVFTIGVIGGILSILLTKFTDTKDIAKTRGMSAESKILPKNTIKRNDFGYPDRSVKE